LLLDLVAVLIIDAHGKWTATARVHPPSSSDTPLSLPCKKDQYHHHPYQLLRSGRILAKKAKLSIVELSVAIWWC
jgi:hypothetical protein